MPVLPTKNEWNQRFISLQTAWTKKCTQDAILQGDTLPFIDDTNNNMNENVKGYTSPQNHRMNTCKDKNYDTSSF